VRLQGLLRVLALSLRLAVYGPGDYVCRKGDIGREMYFVSRGRLVVLADDRKIFATLSDGDYFGEVTSTTATRCCFVVVVKHMSELDGGIIDLVDRRRSSLSRSERPPFSN